MCVCRYLSAAFVCCRLGVAFVYRCHDALFIHVRAVQMSKIYSITDKKSNQWSSIYCRTGIISIIVTIVITNMRSTIKCIGFESVRYTINLDVVSSFCF